jgi:hypothetical protein
MPFMEELSRSYMQADGADFGGYDEHAGCKAAIAGLAQQLEAAQAARDRFQANGKKLLAHYRELESIIAFPGVKNALFKALHPDTGTGGDVASRTAAFQVLMGVFARLGIR